MCEDKNPPEIVACKSYIDLLLAYVAHPIDSAEAEKEEKAWLETLNNEDRKRYINEVMKERNRELREGARGRYLSFEHPTELLAASYYARQY